MTSRFVYKPRYHTGKDHPKVRYFRSRRHCRFFFVNVFNSSVLLSKVKMPKSCCAFGCNYHNAMPLKDRPSFHVFPVDAIRKDRWIQAIHRANDGDQDERWTPYPHAVVCGRHFVECRCNFLSIFLAYNLDIVFSKVSFSVSSQSIFKGLSRNSFISFP